MVSARGGIGYRPGLDGLRGISVLAVLLFHADLGVAPGGFLGVSTFYTLSGFLITSLALDERSRSGRFDLAEFWKRRVRRLFPAALAGLLLAAATAPLFADESQLASLRGDVFWALGYVLNWRLIAEHASYALLFNEPSPVLHFWSLAIEAQFYAVLPLLLAVGQRLRGGKAGVVLFGSLALASVALSAWLTADGATTDRVYYGSDTRASELLVGCALAALLRSRESLVSDLASAGIARVAGVAALAATVVSFGAVSLETGWLYRGGLGVYAVGTAVLVVAALDESGPVGRILRVPPLVFLGRISYGLYVYHWPLYLALTPERLGLGDEATFAARAGVAIALAWASERFLERPVRRGEWLAGPRGAVAAGAGVVLVVGVVLPTTHGAEGISFRESDAGVETLALPSDLDRAVDRELLADPEAGPATPGLVPEAHAMDDSPVGYAFFGDSTMLTLVSGMRPWLVEAGARRQVSGATPPGCGLATDGYYSMGGKGRRVPPVCADQSKKWRDRARNERLDLALVLFGPWDVRPRRLPGENAFRKLGDPRLDAVVRKEIRRAVDTLSSGGALVAWLTAPLFLSVPEKTVKFAEFNEQVARFNELLEEVQANRPERMHLIDFAGYMGADPERHADRTLRADGVHYTREGASRITEDWLGAQILNAQELARARRAVNR